MYECDANTPHAHGLLLRKLKNARVVSNVQ